MKNLKTLLATGTFFVSSFILTANAQTQAISLNPDDWTIEGSGIEALDEDGKLVLEVFSTADPAWQQVYITIMDLDVDKYPKFSITTDGEEGAEWNVKISTPELGEDVQASVFTGNTAGGGDKNTFGKFDFETIPDIVGGGEVSFKLYLWVIGQGEKLVVSDMKFYGDDETGINNEYNPVMLVRKSGGFILNNVENKTVSVFNAGGILIKKVVSTDNKQSIDLPAGFYLVNTGGKTVKVCVD